MHANRADGTYVFIEGQVYLESEIKSQKSTLLGHGLLRFIVDDGTNAKRWSLYWNRRQDVRTRHISTTQRQDPLLFESSTYQSP